jgi:hypothetical protein
LQQYSTRRFDHPHMEVPMRTTHSGSLVWRGAALGALLIGPAFLAVASHESIGMSGGRAARFGLNLGVISTVGPYWPLSWIAGFAVGALAGAGITFITSIVTGKRRATIALLPTGLLAGAAFGIALGTLSQDIVVTVTASSQALVSEHHDQSGHGRHTPSAVTLSSTATPTGADQIMMKGTFSRRRHWGMFAFSIPIGILLGAVSSRGLAPSPLGNPAPAQNSVVQGRNEPKVEQPLASAVH